MSARVTIKPRSLRALRFEGAHIRWLLTLVALVGIAATARNAIAPPTPVIPPAPKLPRSDVGAQAFAAAFARAYLTWDAQDPEVHRNALAPFLGAGSDPDAGFAPPNRGRQAVVDASVVQERPSEGGGQTYTVAVQTSTRAVLHVTVPVRRRDTGALQVVGDPAFVGAPVSAPASLGDPERVEEVNDPAIVEVVRRALNNYLAADVDGLRADLAPGTAVSLPEHRLELRELAGVSWAPSRKSAFARVSASDPQGGLYQLTYELDIDLTGGRPFITAIQTNPYT